jgi:5-methyltetrahydropteroyltriglutamate--homocysteine methyltransferase
MTIPTEPIGSIPRPAGLLTAMAGHAEGAVTDDDLNAAYDQALRDTIDRLVATGSPVVSDGEQRKPSFATYPVAGSADLDPAGAVIPFADGHTRQLPTLTAGPFRYQVHAEQYLRAAQQYARVPVKQAVIAPSALSLLYPADGIGSYPREKFLADLAAEAEADIRGCLDAGAHVVQLDFTEGRLSLKLDPSGQLLEQFITLNNQVLERFTEAERARIGVHTCPGGDCCRRGPGSSSGLPTPSTRRWRPQNRCATWCCSRPATSRPASWAPATTAASRRSPTTPQRPATRRSPRSRPGSREPR